MNKRHLHHIYTKLRVVSYWYFLIACIVFGLIAALALRQNNLTALHMRDDVLKVDQQNGDIETSLRKLREYIYGHMNTDLASSSTVYPPIQLKYRYERLVAAEKARVAGANTSTIYNDAQKYCETTQPQSFYGAGRLPCVQNYIDTHPLSQVKENPIPDSLYKFDFASPMWSPDLAGFSVLFFALFLVLFIIRLGLERWFRHELHSKL